MVKESSSATRLGQALLFAGLVVLVALGGCKVRGSQGVQSEPRTVHARGQRWELNATSTRSQLPGRPLPPQPQHGLVTLSFDDGYSNVYDTAFPIMREYGLVGTANVVWDYVEGWDPNYMHREQLVALQSAGWEIASHSVSHSRPLTEMSLSEAEYELTESAKDLRALGFDVTDFVAPYDAWNADLARTASNCYRSVAAGGDCLNAYPPADLFTLKRVGVYSFTPLTSVYKFVNEAERGNQWLILMFHSVADRKSVMMVPSARFRELVEYLHSRQVEVVTQREAVQLAEGLRKQVVAQEPAVVRR